MAEQFSTADEGPGAPAVPDRRTSERLASDLLIACHPLALPKKHSLPALLRDVSSNGLSLVLRYRFEPGTLLVIDLDGASADGAAPLLGRVVHASAHGDGRWVLGCALRRPLTAKQLQECASAPCQQAEARPAAVANAQES
jgi:hypothetical protein